MDACGLGQHTVKSKYVSQAKHHPQYRLTSSSPIASPSTVQGQRRGWHESPLSGSRKTQVVSRLCVPLVAEANDRGSFQVGLPAETGVGGQVEVPVLLLRPRVG